MDLLARIGPLEVNQNRTRLDMSKAVAQLSSGMRINSAADDPSGLAISEGINAKISGLQRGQENVQDANNLLNVAEGQLHTVASLLQRIRQLIIEARTDLNSNAQLSSIQTEIQQLKLEINKISTSASFNGVHLLDGSLDDHPAKNAHVQEIQANSNVFGDVPSTTVSNADGLGNRGPLIQGATVGNGVEAATVEFQVIGFDPNAVDPITGPIGGPGLYVQVTAYSTDPSFGAGPETKSITAIPENAGPQAAILPTPSGSSSFFQFTIANLTRADVGAAQAFTTYHNVPAGTGAPLSVNYGGTEGSDLQVRIPQVTTEALNISGVDVSTPVVVDPFNVPQGTDSNTISAKDAEVRVSAAIESVSSTRAVIGAQTVALQNAANDSAIQTVNQQASESAIRDADIGKATAQLAKDTILDQIATSTIISVQDSEKSMAGTLSQIISHGPIK